MYNRTNHLLHDYKHLYQLDYRYILKMNNVTDLVYTRRLLKVLYVLADSLHLLQSCTLDQIVSSFCLISCNEVWIVD